jgi:GH24 family phage-related lysozyme (muramidase)
MSLFKIKKTGEIGFFSDKLRPSYDIYHSKVYYFLDIVDPTTDWEAATEPGYYKFTGDHKRVSSVELVPLSKKDLKKAQKNNTMDVLLKPELLEENAEMSQSDVNKIIKYSEELQNMFSINDNLEDWVKAKLNHACDYVATVRDYLKFYRDEKESLQKLFKEARELESKYKNFNDVIDGIQYALDIAGLEPTFGTAADATNVVISLLRAALAKEKNESKKHLLNSAISAVSIIPFGDLAKLIKIRLIRKPAVKLLKFAKKYLNSKTPSYSEKLFEKWTKKYKKSINCDAPKGFSQKAHCRARKLRQSGQPTSSKPVREVYKEVTNQLLKEFNSSMAMGALKQIHNDAKELESMLQPNTQLEDWVKAKLNLAGEYLDDVYHHLDHFGPEGRTLDEVRVSRELEEGWKDWVVAGALGLGTLTGKVDAANVKQPSRSVVQTATKNSESSLLDKKTSDYIGQWEGKRNGVYLDTEKNPTIGIGHYLNNTKQDRDLFNALFGNSVNYDAILNGKQKLTDDQIEKLFNVDVKVKERLASNKISDFESLPQYVKNGVVNGFYRGDIGPKTIKLMNSGNWGAVAKEYLNHQNARSGPEQIQRRMKTNALAFAKYAKAKNEYFGFNYYF